MLKSITLQNFKSFGVAQRVPLESITVLVGPNNAGKSNFLSIGRFVREIAATELLQVKIDPVLLHKPSTGSGQLLLEWNGDAGSYKGALAPGTITTEESAHTAANPQWVDLKTLYVRVGINTQTPKLPPFVGLQLLAGQARVAPELASVAHSLAQSRDVKLSLDALKADSVGADATLGSDGADLAGVINRWRSGDPDRNEQLESFVRSYVPEVRRVLAPAHQIDGQTVFRLEFEQTDGQRFDARHVSDGLLFFTGLVAHVIDAGEGALILLEEPENSIHPRRLHDVVELLRKIGNERKCQFLIATHSPALLDEFRDEPDAILLFRRGPEGTLVRPLSQVDSLREALTKTRPGEMLAHGFFSDGF